MLKAAKVSDPVIRAMINPHPAPAMPRNEAPAPLVGEKGRLPDEVGVYFMRKDELVQLDPEIVGWQTGGVLKHYGTLGIDREHVNGKIMKPKSSLQLSNPIEFLIKTPEGTSATEYQLLRLDEKGNRREFRALTGGVYHASGGSERNAVSFSPEKMGSRIWKIRLDGLNRGEYGFLPPGVSSASIAASGKMYTFGVIETERTTTTGNFSKGYGASAQERSDVSTLGVVAATRDDAGIEILEIQPGSAAGLAGLHVGDIINSVDGKAVKTPAELAAELSNRPPGTKIRLGCLFRTSALGYLPQESAQNCAACWTG